jgi:hypothetical protein
MKFPPTIFVMENYIIKAYNSRQIFLLYDYKHPSNDLDPKTMAMAECKQLARTKTNNGCNPKKNYPHSSK